MKVRMFNNLQKYFSHVRTCIVFSVLTLMSWDCLAIATSLQPHVATEIYRGTDPFLLAPRNALIIGISEFEDGNGFLPLKNPVNDASKVSEALKQAGFNVTNLTDSLLQNAMTRQNIKKAVYDFATLLRAVGGVGLIYYSGHGMERNGRMYLFPYDSFVRFDRDIEEELMPVSLLYDAFAFAGNNLNILIIDACRDSPLPDHLVSFGPTAHDPLSIPSSKNVLSVYSTLSGNKVADGIGNISPYSQAFVDALNMPDLTLSDFFGSVGLELRHEGIDDSDMNIVDEHLIGGRDFVFSPTQVSFNRERDIYNSAITSGNPSIMNNLIWQYAGGYFVAAAEQWLIAAPRQPMKPVINQASRVAELLKDSNIRDGPSLESAIVATPAAGTKLNIVGKTISANGSNWIKVRAPDSMTAAYVRNDRARVTTTNLVSKESPFDFIAGSDVGTETPTVDSINKIQEALKNAKGSINNIAIVGYTFTRPDKKLGDHEYILYRQAVTADALKKLGIDTSSITIPIEETTDSVKDGSVSVRFNSVR